MRTTEISTTATTYLLLLLPVEIRLHILSFLPLRSLTTGCNTCRIVIEDNHYVECHKTHGKNIQRMDRMFYGYFACDPWRTLYCMPGVIDTRIFFIPSHNKMQCGARSGKLNNAHGAGCNDDHAGHSGKKITYSRECYNRWIAAKKSHSYCEQDVTWDVFDGALDMSLALSFYHLINVWRRFCGEQYGEIQRNSMSRTHHCSQDGDDYIGLSPHFRHQDTPCRPTTIMVRHRTVHVRLLGCKWWKWVPTIKVPAIWQWRLEIVVDGDEFCADHMPPDCILNAPNVRLVIRIPGTAHNMAELVSLMEQHSSTVTNMRDKITWYIMVPTRHHLGDLYNKQVLQIVNQIRPKTAVLFFHRDASLDNIISSIMQQQHTTVSHSVITDSSCCLSSNYGVATTSMSRITTTFKKIITKPLHLTLIFDGHCSISKIKTLVHALSHVMRGDDEDGRTNLCQQLTIMMHSIMYSLHMDHIPHLIDIISPFPFVHLDLSTSIWCYGGEHTVDTLCRLLQCPSLSSLHVTITLPFPPVTRRSYSRLHIRPLSKIFRHMLDSVHLNTLFASHGFHNLECNDPSICIVQYVGFGTGISGQVRLVRGI